MQKNNYAQKEEEILEFWKKENIFEKSVDQRPEKDTYVFYDGPPFATGLPHYGHILSSVLKDLFPRYWTMKGKRVRRRWGWDCHGLPIETLVEKKLGISGKKQIEQKGIELFNQTARSMVLDYADQWEKMVDRIGRFVEFENSYKTMDTTYMESVWWALKQIWDKGLIYEGRKVLMYCPRCETPVSNAEVSMDNSYKDITEQTVVIKFKIKDPRSHSLPENTYFLAWTTTPWTLPANVALAVGGNISYGVYEVEGENLIVANDLAQKVFNKNAKLVKKLKGSELTGIFYEPLYEIPAVEDSQNKAWYVAEADFVTTEDGTGVVHTAVIYGEDDFNLGLEIDLPQVPLLNSAGHYNEEAPEFLQGKYIKDVESDIIKDLQKRNLFFKSESHTHSYPFCWRCDNPLIYNAISAWFVDIKKVKSRLIELNEKINWYPGNIKRGRFLNILETAPDWNISRNRYWATALPFFKCEKCQAVECIGSIKELKAKSLNFNEVYKDEKQVDLHRPYIDQVKLECSKCKSKMSRITEVIDCWVESGSMPFAELHSPFENEEMFKSRYPADFIGEYIAQTRAWFYYMHTVGTLLFDEVAYKNVVCTGTILSEKGEKLSKSKQNYPDPWKVIDQYGADSLRFYLMSSVVMQADNLFFNETDLREVYNKVINLINNISAFRDIYNSIEYDREFDYEKITLLDKWLLSRLNNTVQNIENYLNLYNTVKATKELRLFIDDFSTWWLRRSRERFQNSDPTAMSILSHTLKILSQICAPIIPFTAESIYLKLKNVNDPQSVHLTYWPQVDRKMINKQIEENMRYARQIVEAGHFLRNKNSVRVRQPLKGINYSKEFTVEKDQFNNLILDELNIEEVKSLDSLVKKDETEILNSKVAIDFELTEDLLAKGDLRELTRAIQQLRKGSGLKQGEMAKVCYGAEDQKIVEFVKKNIDVIKKETALESFEMVKDLKSPAEVKTSRGRLYLSLS